MGYRWNDVLLGYTNTNIRTYKYFYRPDKQETSSNAPEKKTNEMAFIANKQKF